MGIYTDEVLAMSDAELAQGMTGVLDSQLNAWEIENVPGLIKTWVHYGRFTWAQRRAMRRVMTKLQRRADRAAKVAERKRMLSNA